MAITTSRGSIPEIVKNEEGLYLGDLIYYFKIVFHTAQNCYRPYHNWGHMHHVLYQCYDACLYHQDQLSKREMRNLLIAALMHDFNHSGMIGDDYLNIERSVKGFERCIAEEDKEHFDEIVEIIKATEYPHPENLPSEKLSLPCQIIRDADVSQAMSVTWIQQVIFGLAAEWRIKPIDVLRIQPKFLGDLKFCTEWGQEKFPQHELDEKIEEAKALLELLDDPEFA